LKVVVDSSALLAILFGELDSEEFLIALSQNECSMSSANFLETSIVIDSLKDPVAIRKFDELVKTAEIEIVSVDLKQANLARAAYRDFGKGSGHRAGLNYGDVFAYALASSTRRRLLCKGEDFRFTDIPLLETKSA
jgi:ribonuclease VapC